jgi:hypothetical protein
VSGWTLAGTVDFEHRETLERYRVEVFQHGTAPRFTYALREIGGAPVASRDPLASGYDEAVAQAMRCVA